MLSALVVGGVIGAAVWSFRGSAPSTPRLQRFAIPPPVPETVHIRPNSPDIAISPDGTRIVYTATGGGSPSQFYVRAVEQLTATPLPGLNSIEYTGPFISPDNAWVGFNDETDSTLKRVSSLGGPPVTICQGAATDVAGASWGPDDTIIFGTETPGGLWRVAASGGEPEPLTTTDPEQGQVNHAWPHILPGGRAVLFTILTLTRLAPDGATSGAVEQAQIAVLDLDSGEQSILVPGGSYPRYSPSGHIVYGIGNTLRAVAFDLDRLEVTNPNPVPVVDGVATKPSRAANFDLARDGSLVYISGGSGSGVVRTLVWVNRQGVETALPLPARQYRDPRLSPDGRRVAVGVVGSLWVFDVQSAAGLRLTNEAVVRSPIWTPDGERIIFSWNKEPPNALFWIPADGSGEAERLTTPDAGMTGDYATSVSPDGQAVVFTRVLGGGITELWQVPLDGERTPQPVVQGEFSRGNAALSPDGQWLSYRSNQSGAVEVYLQPYPGPGATTPVSIGGGATPVWSHDGRELFYRVGTRMMVVEVETEPTLRVSPPQELWEEPYFDAAVHQYHVAPDGRFLLIRQGSAATDDATAAPEVILIQNWFEELQRLVPTP